MKKILILILIVIFCAQMAYSQRRVKDIANIKGMETKQLIGYGLVVGLDGSGDGRKSLFTVQSVTNMLMRLGITVPMDEIKLKNVASVIVTATIPPFATKGKWLDLTVSSLGDARSLEGGVLLMTPLKGTDNQIYAYGQGPVSIGGFNIETAGGEQIRKNYTLVGRVPEGAQLMLDTITEFITENKVGINIKDPDFTTASRLVTAINSKYNSEIAQALNAGEIIVMFPSDYQAPEKQIAFISELESLEIQTDNPARIVINERTGTIVIGEQVRIRPVAVAHGNLNIEIRSSPLISQPAPYSGGQTVVVPRTNTTVEAEDKRLLVIDNAANVQNVAKALNALGVKPRDLIAIFQALKKAGALHAELVLM